MKNKEAPIVTFYSYKGGVGRSMALANVAWILADRFHKKVLMIDWDLEAPGLHRFFDLEDSDISGGLIELLNDYKDLLREEVKLPKKLVDVQQYVRRKYIRLVEEFDAGGSISLLAAGRQDKKYSDRINEFSWQEFYAKWHGFGFIEELKRELRNFDDNDIILVDSRTGLTDIGGICTLQLPDLVVVLFALNEQNIAGIHSIVEKISKKAVEIEGRKRPPVLIIRPSRVERSSGNRQKAVKWQRVAAAQLYQYFDGEDAEISIAKKNIPYVSDFSYGETPLAIEEDPLGDMVESFLDLAESILHGSEQWAESSESSLTERQKKLLIPFRLGRKVWKKTQILLLKKKNRYILALFSISLLLTGITTLLMNRLSRANLQLNNASQQKIQLEAEVGRLGLELDKAKQQQLYEEELARLKQIRDALPQGQRRQAVNLAFDLLSRHIPYTYAGRTPETGLDLSGFVDYILSQKGLIKNPAICNQICLINDSAIRPAASLDELKSGDLIFYQYEHTMMYLGSEQCIGMIYNETIEIKDVNFLTILGYGKVPYND